MNRKQYGVMWVAAILVVILLGLKTGEIYKWSDITPSGPDVGHSALFLYGTLVLSSENAGPFHFVLWFGEYKFQLIAVVALLCGVAVFTLRKTTISSRRMGV